MSPERRVIRMDLNRVEGDMEVRLELDGHHVTDAWCVGTMFRGFEQILVGRDPGDALVIAPRICGICSTSQLYAAASALETAYGAPIAPNGTRIRNLCLMAESVMSDARHTFLMFTPDFCNGAYRDHPLFPRVMELFEPPFKGRLAAETVESTKGILAIVIAFGGQWPHSTYMMPGGVTCSLDASKLTECATAIDAYTEWYERAVLGCTCEEWLALRSAEDFDAWIQTPAHGDSAVGVFTRFGRSIGLQELGRGTPHLLSAGCYYDPERWQPPFEERPCLQTGGFYDGERQTIEPFSHRLVAEHLRYARFADPGGARHPWASETIPDDTADEAYSYAKATRYDDHVVQLGPLADLVLAGDPLVGSLFAAEGATTWLRQFTRLHRPVATLAAMRQTLRELREHVDDPTVVHSDARSDGDGFGSINAARGSLGHWLRVRDGKIDNYQVITPTAWNGSPRDTTGRRGHWEESFVGIEIKDLDNPVELFHIVRSHDACLVCTVHVADARGTRRGSFTFW
jgi:Ni,Fe-hydrogenase I large subunit